MQNLKKYSAYFEHHSLAQTFIHDMDGLKETVAQLPTKDADTSSYLVLIKTRLSYETIADIAMAHDGILYDDSDMLERADAIHLPIFHPFALYNGERIYCSIKHLSRAESDYRIPIRTNNGTIYGLIAGWALKFEKVTT